MPLDPVEPDQAQWFGKTGKELGGGGGLFSVFPPASRLSVCRRGNLPFPALRLWQGVRLSPSSPGKTVVYLPANTTAINISATYAPSLWFGMRVERSVMDPTAASRLCARLVVRGQAACPSILPPSGTPKVWGGGVWVEGAPNLREWVGFGFPPWSFKEGVRELTAFPSVAWIPANDPAGGSASRSSIANHGGPRCLAAPTAAPSFARGTTVYYLNTLNSNTRGDPPVSLGSVVSWG